MRDDELAAMVNEIGSRDGMCGFDTSTICGAFALDVAKAVREQCAKLCQQMDGRCPDCAAHNDHAECSLPTPDAYAEMLRGA